MFSALVKLRRFFTSGPLSTNKIRNVAIIAHVDHGKTTLVDKLLHMTNSMGGETHERVMDSGDLEKERGITILSKCTSVFYKDHLINLVDTPGHSDFGGEVERILKMVDGVMLLVDVAEGPMSQTKFVLGKSLRKNLKPIVVLNKLDRNEERAEDAELEVIELFEELSSKKGGIDFPVCYSSSKQGWAIRSLTDQRSSMAPLLDLVLDYIPPPKAKKESPFKFLVSLLCYEKHFGRILTGKISSGQVAVGDKLQILNRSGELTGNGKVLKIFANRGVVKTHLPLAIAGEIVSIAGIERATVSDTVCDERVSTPIQADEIDPPTFEVRVSVNTSPLQGKEGQKITSKQIEDRLHHEARSNVAIAVKTLPDGISCSVKGRGELQLGILFETMRREGFEFEVGSPKVLMRKNESGVLTEPIETLDVEVDEKYSGVIIEHLASLKGELKDMRTVSTSGKSKLIFEVPSRTLLGQDSEIKNMSRGTALIQKEFKGYDNYKGEVLYAKKGRIISMASGKTTSYCLAGIETRGTLMVSRNENVYSGMIVGESYNPKDLVLSPVKAKRLTNIRSAGNDDIIRLAPCRKMTIETAISYIQDDELVEITPQSIRLRKKILDFNERNKNKKKIKSMLKQ